MSKYWIRHRGNVSGPFPNYKIKSLARRGRFNRHYLVSTDGKTWQSAEEFPEFFDSRWQDDDAAYDESDEVGVDDDDELPPKELEWQTIRNQESIFGDDEDIEELEEVRSFRFGSLLAVLPRLNAERFKGLLFVCLGVWLVAIWSARFRQSWSQDVADCDQLESLIREISIVEAAHPAPEVWERIGRETELALSDMVERLEESASARDHVKQELLFISRDECRMAFLELPNGVTYAKDRMSARLARVNEMIVHKWRYHPASVIMPLKDMMAESTQEHGDEKQGALDLLRKQLGENYDEVNEIMSEPGMDVQLPPQ